MHKKSLIAVLLLSLLVTITGCTAAPEKVGNEQNDYTQEKIQDVLTSSTEVSQITWSTDDKQVLYLEAGDIEDNAPVKTYLWKVGEEEAKFVRDISQEVDGFTWSFDSQYFLISEKQGEEFTSSIVKADTLAEEDYQIKSTAIPVWSPDGLSLVYTNQPSNYGENWSSMETYTVGEEGSEYIWKAKDTVYEVEFWDEQGNIGYTEIYKGKETKKTTQNIRPAISEVHLGDNRTEVIAALGDNYQEIAPSGETGHFPEQVYRWNYGEDYTIFIGSESEQVLEIIATAPQAQTNLGVKVGDTAEKVFETYRPQYIEPESIHGGTLYGLFKVEGAAALYFVFDMGEGQSQLIDEIKPDTKVERITLTYPEHMDDSF